jgi:hypothetical protein
MIQSNANKNEQARNAVEWDIDANYDSTVVAVMNCESGDVLHVTYNRNGRAVVWDLLDSHYPSKRAAIRAAKMILIGQGGQS